ncbi:MAG: hypothetical protein ABI587_15105 [Gemmatimonadales bacterium]
MRYCRLASVALLAALAACGAGDTNAPPSLSLSGTWRQSGDLHDATTGDSHIHLGTFALQQAADQFSGTGTQSGICNSTTSQYTGPLADPSEFAVTAGTLTDRLVTFKRDICTYQGSFVEGKSNRITGTMTCAYTLNGVDYSFAGQWQADRIGN